MMSKSLYENIPEKQSKSEMQRIQSGQREFKNTYVPRGPADATPPAPLCKSRLQLFAPERINNIFRPAVDQTEYAKRVIARPPVATRSVSSSSDSSSRFHREEVQTPHEAASDSNSSERSQCTEAGEVSMEALRCLESRLRQLVMSKEALTSPRDSSSDYDTASVLLTPPEGPTRLSTSSRDGSPTLPQRKTFDTRLPVLKLLESNRYGSNFDEGPVSESNSSASLQDFTYDEVCSEFEAVICVALCLQLIEQAAAAAAASAAVAFLKFHSRRKTSSL
ncbi:unnamed protein product [Dibothriocephalus latus]|uniref:Uncharacterized protein n=1 Tax=Dibothriocephalus latus TaxID=60516 RepID=A0A3P7M2Q9_DIBLA|nr:unnamed protein product [Dibothriocephalus latus]